MLTLAYNVPVYVDIDEDTKEVKQVTVSDEEPIKNGDPRLIDSNGDPINDPDLLAHIIEIADQADWPVWEIGF